MAGAEHARAMRRASAPLALVLLLAFTAGAASAGSLTKALEPILHEAERVTGSLADIAEEGAATAQEGVAVITDPLVHGPPGVFVEVARSSADAIAAGLDQDEHACPSGDALPHTQMPWTPDDLPHPDTTGEAPLRWMQDPTGFAAAEGACRYTQLTAGLVPL